MPDNEWVRLTEEGRDWPVAADYRRAGQTLTLHEIQTRWWDDPPETPNGRSVLLTAAELDALAAHAPAVKALVEALRRIEDGAHYRHMMGEQPVWACDYCGEEARDWWHIEHDVACPTHIAHLALAALGADDDPDRPLEDDEFQCG